MRNPHNLSLNNLFILMIICFLNNETYALELDSLLDYEISRTKKYQKELLKYQNKMLEYHIYRKSFLPSVEFSFSPVAFNRSLRLLQDPQTAQYSNIEDFSNTSYGALTVQQKIGPTNGLLTVFSCISFLREFSSNNNSFSTTPFYLAYTQDLRGGYKTYKYTQEIMSLQKQLAEKEFCTSIATERQVLLELFLAVCDYHLQLELTSKNLIIADTLLQMAKFKKNNGKITEYDYNQISIQCVNEKMNHLKVQNLLEESKTILKNKLCTDKEFSVSIPRENKLPSLLEKDFVMEKIHSNNPHILNNQLMRKQASYKYYLNRAETTFNAKISLSYGLNQYAESISMAYNHPFQRQSVNISFSIPIFQWGINRCKRKIAENSYKSSLLEIEEEQDNWTTEIISSINNYNLSVHSVELARQNYQQNQRQYILAVEKFNYGKISVSDICDINKNMYSSQKQYITTLYNCYLSYYNLQSLSLYDYMRNQDLRDHFIKLGLLDYEKANRTF